MGIDKLGSIANAISLMRGEMKRRVSSQTTSSMQSLDETAASPEAVVHDIEGLKTELLQLVVGVDVTNQDDIDVVKPKIIRAILLWEFGQSLRNHPEWSVLMERIQTVIESMPDHKNQFKKIISEIKSIK
jgi:hypothetical protein